MNNFNMGATTGPDMSRLAATDNDTDFSLSLEEVAALYHRAGHPRTLRSLQRYCVSGHLDARKIATALGDKYLVTPQSVARHIAQIAEFAQLDFVATGRDLSRQVATGIIASPSSYESATSSDKARQQIIQGTHDIVRQSPTSDDIARHSATDNAEHAHDTARQDNATGDDRQRQGAIHVVPNFSSEPSTLNTQNEFPYRSQQSAPTHDTPRQSSATSDVEERQEAPLGSDTVRQGNATVRDSERQGATRDASPKSEPRYVELLERQLEIAQDERDFLREQINRKDRTIESLIERDRETNVLVRGLQEMLTPLLGGNRQDHPPTYRQ